MCQVGFGIGRRLAMEVLKNVSGVANLIRSGNWHQLYSALQTHRKDGLNTLEHHLGDLVEKGEILPKDALQYANDPQAMEATLGSLKKGKLTSMRARAS